MPCEIPTEEELAAAESRDRPGRVLLIARQAEALLQRMITFRPRDVASVVEFVRHVFLWDEIAIAISRQDDVLKIEGRRALEPQPRDGVVYAELFVEAVLAGVDARRDIERAREREAEFAKQSRSEDVRVIDRRDFIDRRVDVLESGQQRRHSERARRGDELGSLRARVADVDAVSVRKLMVYLSGVLIIVNLIRVCHHQVVDGERGRAKIRFDPQSERGFGRRVNAVIGDPVVSERLAGLRVSQGQPGHTGKIALPPRFGRNARERLDAASLAQAFKVEKEERAVLDDWAADCSAKLIAVELSAFGQKEIARVELVVAQKFEGRAVKLVRAGFGDERDLAEGGLSEFGGVRIGLNLEFLYYVDRRPQRDVAELPRVVAGAVNREIIVRVATADGHSRTETAG